MLGSAGAHAQSSTYWCSAHPALKTCVVSATFDGNPILSSDATYDVFAIPTSVGGAKTVLWGVQLTGPGDLSAALGHTFGVTIQTNIDPREMDGFGASMTYDRSGPSSGEYTVTLTGQPVSVTDQNGCTFPPGGPTCTAVAPGPSSAIFQGEISDYNYAAYNDPSNYPAGFVDSFDGMEMWTNIAETGLPPNLIVVDGQNELELDLADHHFEHDGTTVVHGDFFLRIPATFLATYWGINDPNTLATDGLNASIGAGGGTVTVTVEPGNAAVDVQISGMTFSRRHLKIELGVVTPRAPKNVKAVRNGATTARITFIAAKPRGQKVKGYGAFCRAAGKSYRFTVVGRHSPAVVEGLTPGVPYTCTLRARSRAGYGNKSKPFSIRA
jgi:hypothetical protein